MCWTQPICFALYGGFNIIYELINIGRIRWSIPQSYPAVLNVGQAQDGVSEGSGCVMIDWHKKI
jgi:hypothetical protein